MFNKLLYKLLKCRERKFFAIYWKKRSLVHVRKNKNAICSYDTCQRTKRIHYLVTLISHGNRSKGKNDMLDRVGKNRNNTRKCSRTIATAGRSMIQEGLTQFTSPNNDKQSRFEDTTSNSTGEMNSIEKILDETNSMIYVNEICLQMDKSILKCQTYEDILSILITHRGALFLQNLITVIRMLAGLVIEERKKRKNMNGMHITFSKYTNRYVNAEGGNNNLDGGRHNEKGDILNNNIEHLSNESNTTELFKNKNITGFDKIEKSLIEKYQHIFDVLNNKDLLESENNFQNNRMLEGIIVRDERFNLLIDDIYKNRKHFDVVSICHILISLKELNYKHFLLFNSFINPLKNFDKYIKEQFERSNQKIAHIHSVIQLLLQCFNTYIWAGYYNLDIYNRLINSILLNNFILIKKEFIYEQHYEQFENYNYMNYKYDVNYPLSSNEIFTLLNLNENYFSKKNFLMAPLSIMMDEDKSNINEEETYHKDCKTEIQLNDKLSHRKSSQLDENKISFIQNPNLSTRESFTNEVKCVFPNESESIIARGEERKKKEIPCYCCPIFLNLELFLRSVEIYKNIYVYNPEFFKISEKVVYYYTQYLSPFNLSILADAFSKHRIFAIEHDRFFYHISKLMENNFDKFSYENIFLILNSFKRMNLFFEKCIILSANKFEPYFHELYINRKEGVLTLKQVSVLIESLSFFDFHHKSIDQCIIASVNYLEDYIDEIDEETSINISYALILSNLYHINTYFFSFIWRKIAKTTYWEKKKNQVCLLWLSHMIQFKWMEYDLPKFCVLECLKIFYLKRKENMFSYSKIISSVSQILDELQIRHDVSVDIYGPYILDILITGDKRHVIMLTQDTTRNEINRQLGDSKIVSFHLTLYGYNVRPLNTKYFDVLSHSGRLAYVRDIVSSF
ncbi:hypothetical protein, conserved [Plasmodium gonderi]|uniref:RAP domain-containing protein n=1 Tax=Plasmodium gonderi TaxID=77519 RepID=A0A1Y1JR71_PLAGO|nr:hypothetical protein, conserved [Plasmodium gonderi]GAW82524.1 hypothetical protein, conserved [Plasmodium gonderi]